MSLKTCAAVLFLGMWSIAGVRTASAQFAVIDVASIAQLLKEVQQLEQQVATARSQLSQAQSEYAAITGGRGMQNLLSGTVRNYLPTDWSTLSQVMSGNSGSYPALGCLWKVDQRPVRCGHFMLGQTCPLCTPHIASKFPSNRQ